MSFIQPLLLLAMPLIGLPIVIHLLNHRRHKTSQWAATRFVRQATNMNRGSARLRHWLVLALRAAAIAAMVFVMSRPIASQIPGLGFLGSQREQLIIMDRSPSMALQDSTTGLTWSQTVISQLQNHLNTAGLGEEGWLFHSLTDQPIQVKTSGMAELLQTQITATESDIPLLIERALDHVQGQAVGPADLWVCTDRQASDWNIDSGRWNRIRERLAQLSDVQLHVLLPELSDEFNLAVAVTRVVYVQEGDQQFALLDFSVKQTSGAIQQRQIPIKVAVGGVQQNLEIELTAGDFEYQQLKVELPGDTKQGAGFIQLPSDANAADNRYYFAYAPEPVRRSVVVSDSPQVAELVQLVCTTAAETNAQYDCSVLPVSGQFQVAWQDLGFVIWHAPLPDGLIAKQMETFVAKGGTVLFLPVPDTASEAEMFGVQWGDWDVLPSGETEDQTAGRDERQLEYRVAQWRTEDDILATDESGRALPMDSIGCSSRRKIQSADASMLASFEDGQPLLVRAATEAGAVYFLSTTPDADSSSFTDDGIALYVMLHRALEQGTGSLAKNQQLQAGQLPAGLVAKSTNWKPFADAGSATDQAVAEDQRGFFAGVYESGDQVIAVNRASSEDESAKISESELASVLDENSFDMVSISSASFSNLTNEIWKLFVAIMIAALIAEGWLSLPRTSSGNAGRHTELRNAGRGEVSA